MSATDTAAVQAAEVRRFLSALRRPGEVVELRALDVRDRDYGKGRTYSGYFLFPDHLGELAKHAVSLTRVAGGVYVVANPVHPGLLARAFNRVQPDPKHTTSDAEVTAYRWLLVDVDPVRPAGVSATDAEREHARAVLDRVRDGLAAMGWGRPVLCDSGNGFHALVPVDAPVAKADTMKAVLAGLAARFDTPEARIDTSTYNPARLVKLPGTFARKGDHVPAPPHPDIPARPHRMGRVLEAPKR